LYAYTVSPDFEEIALVSLSTALLLRKPLYVSVNDDKGRSEDEKPLHKLMAEGLHSRNGLRSTLRSVVFHNARRVICRIATASFVTTPLVADFARDVLGARRVLVVGRGLGEAWISQDWKKDTHKEYDASYLGRIDALKGIDSLLDGWKCVVTERKDARLLLIGDGDRLQEAKTRVREAGMELNVTFAGYVADEEQIRKMLRSSRMFVFLSRKEGFANAVAQAMSCALPCVLSDIPELKAVYGQSAIYVDPHDPRALSESILGLLYDRNKSRYYGESGRRLVEKLTWARTGDAILAAMQLA
jgi:glycosyltransferase involved in cell wall biosynthesis